MVVEAYFRIGAFTYTLLIPLAALTLPNSIIFRNDAKFQIFCQIIKFHEGKLLDLQEYSIY